MSITSQVKIIELSKKEKMVIGKELKKHLNKKNKGEKVEVLGMIASNVYAFAHSSELSSAWDDIMELKKSKFGKDASHYGAMRNWEEIPGSVNQDRAAFRNPQLAQRFDIIIMRVH